MSPFEQIEIINRLNNEYAFFAKDQTPPSKEDYERYYYYVEKGTDVSMIAPLPDVEFKKFAHYLPTKFKSSDVQAGPLYNSLKDEIQSDYSFSMRKSIVDYVLMNVDERRRLRIQWTPKNFDLKLVVVKAKYKYDNLVIDSFTKGLFELRCHGMTRLMCQKIGFSEVFIMSIR